MSCLPWLAILARALCGAFLASALPALAAGPIERVEPPFWWRGMAGPELQLMLHGPQIGQAQVELKSPVARIVKVTPAASPNYLFIDLRLQPGAQPAALDLRFRRGSERFALRYELRQREPGSAQRRGFGRQDAIYNLMPDRFANGDPHNDRLPDDPDRLDRSDDSAGRHGGDLAGMAAHLDYIAGMGFTMLWPTPLTETRQPAYSYHGYAATDTYRIDPRYGSNESYREFVALARRKGVGVIQDVVLNHIGSGHWWMKDLPMPDWLSQRGHFVPTRHARTAVHDPYAAPEDRENFVHGWFETSMPDMNQKNPFVATYQIQNTLWWIEYAGLAGLRVDTYGYSDARFLTEWSRRVMQEYPRLNLVGEEWSPIPHVVAYWQRGRKNHDGYVSHLPSLMDYPLHGALRRALTEPDGFLSGLTTLHEQLVNDSLYPDPGNLVLFEGNHDVSRLYSALDEDLDLCKMALVYLATARRIPQFYYGTEILMTSPKQRDDGAFRRDFPGGWPGDAVNAFTGQGLTPRQLEAQQFMRMLLNWRKQQPVVHEGSWRHYAPEQGTYVYFRVLGERKLMVVLNKNRNETVLDLERFAAQVQPGQRAREVLSDQALTLQARQRIPARSAWVLELEPARP
jgi:glycosidase